MMSPIYLTEYDLRHGLALRSGLPREEAEDCAQEFEIQRFLRRHASAITDPNMRVCSSLLRYEYNLKNAWRYYRRRLRREVLLTALDQQEEERLACLCADPAADPACCALRAEFWEQIRRLCRRLAPIPREVFWRHHRQEERVPEIAASIGKTVNATYQILKRANRQMGRMLERRGLNEALLRKYVEDCRSYASTPHALPARHTRGSEE